MISAEEVSRPTDDICILLAQWNPPANSDVSDIAKYIVYVPSRNISESDVPFTVSTLTVPNCGDDIGILVAAVNRIGCAGLNSSEVQPSLIDIPMGPITAESVSTASISDSEGGSASTSRE